MEYIRSRFDVQGPDTLREIERKLNANYAELCAATGTPQYILNLTVSASNGQIDSPRVTELKINTMNAAIAAASNIPPPEPVYLAYKPQSYYSPFQPMDILQQTGLQGIEALLTAPVVVQLNKIHGDLSDGGLPRIVLSNVTVSESTSIGSTIGTLSVVNGSGTYTFTEFADPDSKFAVSGTHLTTSAALNFESAQSHTVTVRATNGVDAPITRTFTILVANVLEVTLGTLGLSGTNFVIGTSSSGTITGASAGSSITATGLPAGLSIDSVARTWSWSGTGSPVSSQLSLVEYNSDATNSPRTNNISYAVRVPLAALSGTFTLAESAIAGTVAGGIGGQTPGSTLTLIDDAGGRVALSGNNIVRGLVALDYETATSHTFTVRETYSLGSNSPRDTVLTLNVTDVVEAVPSINLGSNVSVAEGNSGPTTVTTTVTVNRAGLTGSLLVNLSYGGGATSGVDYATPPSTVTIASGQNTATFDVVLNGDTDIESDEQIIISATLAAYPSATATRVITITNDDAAPSTPSFDFSYDTNSQYIPILLAL